MSKPHLCGPNNIVDTIIELGAKLDALSKPKYIKVDRDKYNKFCHMIGLVGPEQPKGKEEMSNNEHCLICGMSHSPKVDCPVDAFEYFICSSCGRTQKIPNDAMMFGLTNMTCGCGVNAEENWRMSTYDNYKRAGGSYK